MPLLKCVANVIFKRSPQSTRFQSLAWRIPWSLRSEVRCQKYSFSLLNSFSPRISHVLLSTRENKAVNFNRRKASYVVIDVLNDRKSNCAPSSSERGSVFLSCEQCAVVHLRSLWTLASCTVDELQKRVNQSENSVPPPPPPPPPLPPPPPNPIRWVSWRNLLLPQRPCPWPCKSYWSFFIFFSFFLYFLRQSLTYPKLALSSLCSWGWPWILSSDIHLPSDGIIDTPSGPASAVQGVKLWLYAYMLGTVPPTEIHPQRDSKEQQRPFPRDHCFSWFLYILGFKSSFKEILTANVSLENLDSLAMFQTQRTRHLSFFLDTSHFKMPCLTLGFPSLMRPRKFESLQSVLLFFPH